jgi:hypothetical protein
VREGETGELCSSSYYRIFLQALAKIPLSSLASPDLRRRWLAFKYALYYAEAAIQGKTFKPAPPITDVSKRAASAGHGAGRDLVDLRATPPVEAIYRGLGCTLNVAGERGRRRTTYALGCLVRPGPRLRCRGHRTSNGA